MHAIGSLLLPVLLATSTWAHGHVMTITIAGKAFNGNIPNGPKGPSVIRQISTPDPNHFANNTALTCGPDSTPGTLIADANPGDEVTFDWKGGDLGPVRLSLLDNSNVQYRTNLVIFSGHTALAPCSPIWHPVAM